MSQAIFTIYILSWYSVMFCVFKLPLLFAVRPISVLSIASVHCVTRKCLGWTEGL